jgi:hypothetical protein
LFCFVIIDYGQLITGYVKPLWLAGSLVILYQALGLLIAFSICVSGLNGWRMKLVRRFIKRDGLSDDCFCGGGIDRVYSVIISVWNRKNN